MNVPYTPIRSQHSLFHVGEGKAPYTPDSSQSSEGDQFTYPDELPRRIQVVGKDENTPQTFFVLSKEELRSLLAVARQCKAQAKLIADSLLKKGSKHITEANAAYGLERQMAELQEEVSKLME